MSKCVAVRDTRIAVLTFVASWQNRPALGQLTIAILGFFAPFARALQKDVDASDTCGSNDVVSNDVQGSQARRIGRLTERLLLAVFSRSKGNRPLQ